jgi:hypothetical protein
MVDQTNPEVLTKFIKGCQKASGTGETTEATHRIVTLFDGSMVLLNPVIQVLIGSVQYLAAQNAPNGVSISQRLYNKLCKWSGDGQ